ncbi:MAG: VanW family protein [Desulfitobacteriaceae bacterium]
MLLGKIYFTLYRYLQWMFIRSIKYAAIIQTMQLPYIVAIHKTPLFRQLRQVDMWLQENKVNNLKLATERINGLVLRPGETFSFWRLVGKPTKAKGFLDGMVLTNGSFTTGVGGGLCQLSNLIYWMALNSSLTVTERWRHTHDVFPDANRTQPFGSGATVVYNYVDLQIRNDTTYDYQLLVRVGNSDLEGEWRCEQPCTNKYEVYESDHLITQEWWGGYMRHNVIRRKVFKLGNNQIDDDFITENHAIMMYEPMLAESTKNV